MTESSTTQLVNLHLSLFLCFKAVWKKAEWSVSEDELFICLNRPHDLYGFSE